MTILQSFDKLEDKDYKIVVPKRMPIIKTWKGNFFYIEDILKIIPDLTRDLKQNTKIDKKYQKYLDKHLYAFWYIVHRQLMDYLKEHGCELYVDKTIKERKDINGNYYREGNESYTFSLDPSDVSIDKLRKVYNLLSHITYGMYDASTDKMLSSSADDEYMNTHVRILTPEEVVAKQLGTCWDQALAVSYYLKQKDINYCFCFIENSKQTHTFNLVHAENGWYWIETAWSKYKGIHGPYETKQKALDTAADAHSKFSGSPERVIRSDIGIERCWTDKNLTIGKFLTKMQSQFVQGTEALDEDINARKYVPRAGDIAIRFADRVLWFNRYPLDKSLIVSGLDYFDCEQYELSALESPDIYYRMLQDKGLSTNYLKGISSFFDLFVDNMTYEVLRRMGEPTTVRGLLARAAQMLSTLDYRPPSSRENHRLRGMEQVPALVYNEMSRQFAAYQARRGKANSFAINPDAIFLRFISNASLVTSEDTNPIRCLEEKSEMTYAGAGGRSSDSFVLRDRAYAVDDIGVISEATVDNYKVAINAQLSLNAGITDTLGTLKSEDINTLQPADVLSNAALLLPFSTNDDTKRINY